MIFLTKTEFLLAAGAALAIGLLLRFWADRTPTPAALSDLACFAGAALLPPLLAVALLSTAMPVETAVAGLLAATPLGWLALRTAVRRRRDPDAPAERRRRGAGTQRHGGRRARRPDGEPHVIHGLG